MRGPSSHVWRSLWAVLPCALIYFYVFPYFPEINNPNENVRFHMTAALVEEGRYEINTMRQRWGWTNDAACVDRSQGTGPQPCTGERATGTQGRAYYSVKAPGSSLLGVPAYALYRALSGQRFNEATAMRVVRIGASIIPALIFLFFFHLWLRNQVESALFRNATFFSMALGSAFCAYALVFTSHTQAALCGFGAFMLLERAHRKRAMGAFAASAAGFLAAGATAFEYPGIVVSVTLCAFALFAIRPRTRLIAFGAGALLPTLAVMHFQWRAFGSPVLPGHLFVETKAFRAAYEQGFFGADGFHLEAAWRLLFDLRMGLLSMTPVFIVAPLGWWVLTRQAERRPVAVTSVVLCASLYLLICLMNNWSGGWVVGPRYLVMLIPFFAWAASVGLQWLGQRRPSFSAMIALGGTVAALLAGGLPSIYYPHIPDSIDWPLKHLFAVLVIDEYAPINAGRWLGLHGTASMVPVFAVWFAVVAALFRFRGQAVRGWAAGGALFVATVLLAPQFLAPAPDAEVQRTQKFVKSHWTPKGFDRETRLARKNNPRPNVILLSIDTLRADHLTMYGYDRNTSPNLAALARDAVLFEQAYSAHTNTAPAHASMLTSLYPMAHGIRRNGMQLKRDVTTLPDLLKNHGYTTAAFVSGWTLQKHTKLERGFETYDDHLPDYERTADATYDVAYAWLEDTVRQARPFFLFLHFFDPHYIYRPEPHYAEQFLPAGTKVDNAAHRGIPGYGWKSLTPARREEFVARYDGEIAFADEQVGRLLADLKALGEDERTIIVFVSDHGETLFERDWGFDHGARTYDEQIRVPFMIRFADRTKAGTRVTGQVHHVDILPTLIESLSLPPVEAAVGRSLIPLIEGDGTWAEPRPVFSHARPEPSRMQHLKGRAKLVNTGLVSSIRLPHVKLIEYPIKRRGWYRELFLLQTDPEEMHNVSDDNKALSDALHGQLELWRASGDEAPAPSATEIPEEVKEGLRALGYME